jgi:6-phosphogluconolactonase (cycloisomerase 2 family)
VRCSLRLFCFSPRIPVSSPCCSREPRLREIFSRARIMMLAPLLILLPSAALQCQQSTFLYSANAESNDVSAYSINSATGALTQIPGSPFFAAADPHWAAITIDPYSRFAYASDYATATITGFAIDPSTGALISLPGSPYPAASAGPRYGAIDPAGKYFYMNSSNEVSEYTINQQNGALTLLGSPYATGTAFSFGLTCHPNGHFLFVANVLTGTLSVLAIDPSTGVLTVTPGSPVAAGSSPSGVAVDSSGRFVYVSNTNGGVVAFQIDATTGVLTPLNGSPFATPGGRAIATDPHGQFVFVANESSGSVSAFTIDQTTGALAPVPGSPFVTGPAPTSLIVDPTSTYLYVAATDSNNIYGYQIAASTGVLTPVTGSPFVAGQHPFSLAIATPTTASTLGVQFIQPTHGGNAGNVTIQIFGAGFESGATVTLTGLGADIVAISTSVPNSSVLNATFDLTGATPGVSNLVLTNPDGTTATLTGAFTVDAGGGANVVVDIIGRPNIRFGTPQTYYIQVNNTGFVDSGPIIVSVQIPSVVQFQQFEGSGLYIAGTTSSPDFAIPSAATPDDQELLFATTGVPAGSAQLAPIQFTLQPSSAALLSGLPSAGLSALASTSGFNARAASQESIADLSVDQFLGLENIPLIPFFASYPQCTSQFYSELNAYDRVLSFYSAVQGARLDTISAIALLPVELGKTTAAALVVIAAAPALEALLPATAAGAVANSFAGLELGNVVTNGLSCAQSQILTDKFQGCLEALKPDWTTLGYGGIAGLQSVVSAETAGLPAGSAAALDAKVFASELNVLQTSVQLAVNGISSAGDIIQAYGAERAARGLLDQSLGPYSLARSAYQACINNSQPPPPPINPPGTNLPINGVASLDPNDIAGPVGSGQQNYITGTNPFTYGVFYSNEVSATAPAQNVVVTNQLDITHENLLTFSLGPITIGSQVVSPPPYSNNFQTTLDLRPTTDLLVAIKASLDRNTGLATWTYMSIDPATNQPPTDPTTGFLPPGGQGSLFFTVTPKNGLATNVQIVDAARVVFDTNAPISTPIWTNTIDNTQPTSHVVALPGKTWMTDFTVSWTGSDIGSGVQGYSIYVSVDGGPFSAWLANVSATSATYAGQIGHTYSFYSIANDNVGNVESAKTAAEATTSVMQDTTPPVIMPTVTGSQGQNGWYISGVAVSWSVTDPESSIASSSGCTAVALSTNTAGTTITCSATNGAGLSSFASVTIKIDQTQPVISGMPPAGCDLWAPDHKLVRVARVTAADALSGLASFTVTGTSNEPGDPNDRDDIRIEGAGLQPRTIYLRADKLGREDEDDRKKSDRKDDDRDRGPRMPKVYTLTATATDLAGNTATTTSTCTVTEPGRRDRDR